MNNGYSKSVENKNEFHKIKSLSLKVLPQRTKDDTYIVRIFNIQNYFRLKSLKLTKDDNKHKKF